MSLQSEIERILANKIASEKGCSRLFFGFMGLVISVFSIVAHSSHPNNSSFGVIVFFSIVAFFSLFLILSSASKPTNKESTLFSINEYHKVTVEPEENGLNEKEDSSKLCITREDFLASAPTERSRARRAFNYDVFIDGDKYCKTIISQANFLIKASLDTSVPGPFDYDNHYDMTLRKDFLSAILNNKHYKENEESYLKICEAVSCIFSFYDYYYFKPGWKWDPVAAIIEAGYKEAIPSELYVKEWLAFNADSWEEKVSDVPSLVAWKVVPEYCKTHIVNTITKEKVKIYEINSYINENYTYKYKSIWDLDEKTKRTLIYALKTFKSDNK